MLAWGLMSGAGGHASLDTFFDSLWREPKDRDLDKVLDNKKDFTPAIVEAAKGPG